MRDLVSDESLRRWYAWGWLPLVAGSAAIVLIGLGMWEIALHALGYRLERGLWWLLVARGLLLSAALAAWAGWFVLRARRHIDAARSAFQMRQAEIEAEARRTEHLAGLGALTRTLAHEIKNPLNSLSLNTRILQRHIDCRASDAEQCRRLLEVQAGEIARLDRLVEDYLSYSKGNEMVLARVAIAWPPLIAEVLDVHRAALETRGVRVDVDAPAGAPCVHADPARLRQLLHNLIRNELDALAPGSMLRVAVAAEGDSVALMLTDDGPGFEDPSAVFRPFYTTKATGHGLGLAVVSDIVRAHGGEAVAENVPGPAGARITVRLPAAGRG